MMPAIVAYREISANFAGRFLRLFAATRRRAILRDGDADLLGRGFVMAFASKTLSLDNNGFAFNHTLK